MESTQSGPSQRADHTGRGEGNETPAAPSSHQGSNGASALQWNQGSGFGKQSDRAGHSQQAQDLKVEDSDAQDGEIRAASGADKGGEQSRGKSSIEEAMNDYRSVHRKQYEERLKRERDEEEKARRMADEQRGFELAAKLQREEENRSATRLAADAEMSRQLFAQLNQHLLPAALSSRTAQPVGATLTSPRDDAVSSGYSSEWLDRLREQHEEEESRQQRYSAFPTQAGEDNVRPPMRTNYSERLIDDTPAGWLPSERGFSDSLLHPGVGREDDGTLSWFGNILRDALGIPPRATGGNVTAAQQASRRRRAVYASLVCILMLGPLIVALVLLVFQAMQ